MRTRVAREAAIFLGFLVLSVILTWPLARNLRTALPDLGDPLLTTFIIDWDMHALTHDPVHLFDAPFYQPAIYTLAYTENLLGIAIVMLPFHLLGAAPLTLYNIAFLLGFALSGYGAYVLARVCGRSMFASIVAGIFFAFCPFKIDHLSHIQIIWSGWLPLMFAALFAYWRRPTTKGAVLLCGAFVMNGLTNIHWLLFGSFTLAATIVFLTIVEWRGWKALLRVVAAIAIGSALLIPMLLPYRVVSKVYGMKRAAEEVMYYSATWQDWLIAPGRSLLYGPISEHADVHGERLLFPGAAPVLLTLIALFTIAPRFGAEPRRRRMFSNGAVIRLLDVLIVVFAFATYIGATTTQWEIKLFHHRIFSIDNAALPAFYLLLAIVLRLMLRMPRALGGPANNLGDWFAESRFTPDEWSGLMWIAIGVIGSLGLNGVLHGFLFRHVEAFKSLRVPARWAIIAYLGLVIWSSLGVDLLLRARAGVKKRAIASGLAILALLDVSSRVRWQQMVVAPDPVYEWLRTAPLRGYAQELPTSGWSVEFFYLFGNTQHHQRMMNGTSGFEPPVALRIREMTERGEMNDVFMNELERHHCELVIVHSDWLGEQKKATMRWLGEQVASGHLAFVRRFDHWIDGDWVFAVTHASNDWERFREPQTPDAAGFTPDEEVQRFLRGEPTYNSAPFVSIDSPQFAHDYHGPLRVAGWTLAPNGVSRVRVFLNGGEKIYDTTFLDRPDVVGRWPWYPKMKQAGFQLELPKRPKGMSRDVNVQIEITDGAGHVSRSFDLPITWD